jgi:CheY-like chemotaxis protein
MSGYEVASALRAEYDDRMQIIAVSGYAQPDDVKRAIDAGFDRHVAKPVDALEIERLLASCACGHGEAAPVNPASPSPARRTPDQP